MTASVLELSRTLSHKEVEVAYRYLSATRNAVVRAVGSLTTAQATFVPAPARWSVADVVEHLSALEDLFVNRIVARVLEAPPSLPAHDVGSRDARVIGLERNPATRVVEYGRDSLAEAPAATRPTGRFTLEESLQRFVASRERTIRVLQSVPDLRQHVIEHRGLGPLDGYQWLLFLAAHTERHLRQIDVLKNDAQFPAAAFALLGSEAVEEAGAASVA